MIATSDTLPIVMNIVAHACHDSVSKERSRKVQFMATILHGPEVLTFDEPHSALGPVNT